MKNPFTVKWLMPLSVGLILLPIGEPCWSVSAEESGILMPPPAEIRSSFDEKAKIAKSTDRTIDEIDYVSFNVDELLARIIEPALFPVPVLRPVKMPLLGDQVRVVTASVTEGSRGDTYEWLGYIEDELGSSVVFVVSKKPEPSAPSEAVVGIIRRRSTSGEVTYLISPDEKGMYSVARYLSRNFPPELSPRTLSLRAGGTTRSKPERGPETVVPRSPEPKLIPQRLPPGELQLRPRLKPLIPDFGLPTTEEIVARIRSRRFPSLPKPPLAVVPFVPKIDVMVLYTPAAQGSRSGWVMRLLINTVILDAEVALQRSGVLAELNLVDWGLLPYTENNTASEEKDNLGLDLSDIEQGGIPSVYHRRACSKADTVSIWIKGCDGCQYCGLSNLNDPIGPTSRDNAFQVVRWNCAMSVGSFAHELGHTMGAHHDRGASDTDAVGTNSGHNFGHLNTKTSYRRPDGSTYYESTIMAERKTDNSVERLNYWSNPNIFEYSDLSAMGVAPPSDPNAANNHLTLNANIPVAARFGEGLPAPSEPCGNLSPPSAPSGLKVQ